METTKLQLDFGDEVKRTTCRRALEAECILVLVLMIVLKFWVDFIVAAKTFEVELVNVNLNQREALATMQLERVYPRAMSFTDFAL